MEVRVKERLVGAIALVAIVVLVVPAILTGERSPPPRAVSSGSVPVRSVDFDLNRGPRDPIERSPAPSATAAAPAPTPVAAPAQAPSAESGAAAPATSVADAPTPASAVPPPAPAAPVAGPPAAAPAARAGAAAAHVGDAWIVQIGSFASREHASQFAVALRAKGYAAFVSEFHGSGKVLYRVRVGPEQDRARVDAIAARLAREGYPGKVVPEP